MSEPTTYKSLSDTCSKFYDLIVVPAEVAEFVLSKLETYPIDSALFVGGFFLVAKKISEAGINLTVVDYTDDMVREGQKRLPDINVQKADLRALPFHSQFDCIFVIGRVFTHMLTAEDAHQALSGLHTSLKPGGILFFDNYEDSKIQVTDYFNGRVVAEDSSTKIIRDSTTELVSTSPLIVNWKAQYSVNENGNQADYHDEMHHRAFSRGEIQRLLDEHQLVTVSQGDNFDDTSFYTLAEKPMV